MLAQDGARVYRKTQIATAGKIKAYLMLLDKGILLLSGPLDRNVLNEAQNILAQMQSSLDTQYRPAQELYLALGHLWDLLETEDGSTIPEIVGVLLDLRETLKQVDRKSGVFR